MAEPRLVIVTRDGAAQRFVANALCAAFEIEAIVVDSRPQAVSWKRAMRRGPLTVLSKAGRTLLLKALGDARAKASAERRLLAGAERFTCEEKIRFVDGINSEASIALLRALKPDLLLVYGTGVVKRKVLKLAADLALNLHTGVSPWYRGTACAFWPVVNGEFDKIGATVHECVPALDGGRIFEVVRIEPEPHDDLHGIFARCVVAGAAAYVRVVGLHGAGRLEGEPQDLTIGREYGGVELGLWPEIKARWRLARRRRSGRMARA